jgi:hypothetical protein
MELTLPAVSQPRDDVWEADVPATDLALLGDAAREDGSVSVVLINGDVRAHGGRLSFDHAQATVLNRGSTPRTILVRGQIGSPAGSLPSAGGDAAFLDSLPKGLKSLGSALLERVRRESPGELRYHETSRRYVETPDNFWTVKVQPRDGSLRLTVRGDVSRFADITGLSISPDRNGYSGFKIANRSELGAAVAVIRRAPRRLAPGS